MLRVLKRDDSFEHPKHMFKLVGKEINAILSSQTILIWAMIITYKSKNTYGLALEINT